ncbi:MAG: hypothetical protein KF850_14350 [Labilithrix sp.]|nr:hypothetical protein [Labilithrix sp.]
MSSRWRLCALGLVATTYGLGATAGCSADSAEAGATPPDGGPDSGAEDGDRDGSTPDGATDSGAGPRHAPSSLRFGRDQDPRRGLIAGTVVIGRASDESDVKAYNLYWGSDPTTKVGTALAALTKTGDDIAYELDASVPDGAAHLIALSVNDEGEMDQGATTPATDNFPTFVDISVAQDGGVAWSPSAVVDEANGKLLVAITNRQASNRLGLVHCNLDGTDCKLRDISAVGGATYTGANPSAVIDKTLGKLLVATENGASGGALGFFSCNLDGSEARAHNMYTAGPRIDAPSAVLDATNGRLLVATTNMDNNARSHLYSCAFSTGTCSGRDISPDGGVLTLSARQPAAAIDSSNGSLLVVSYDSTSSRSRLARCNLDGTNCTFQLVPFGLSGPFASLVDSVSRKLLVVGPSLPTLIPGSGTAKPALTRCDLDTDAGCTAPIDISAGQPNYSGSSPSAVIDTANGKLLVVAVSRDHFSTMGLFRCNLDGTSCTHTDISVGHENIATPSAVIDEANGRLLVAASYTGSRLGLFSIALW